jgi:hypothetical protein
MPGQVGARKRKDLLALLAVKEALEKTFHGMTIGTRRYAHRSAWNYGYLIVDTHQPATLGDDHRRRPRKQEAKVQRGAWHDTIRIVQVTAFRFTILEAANTCHITYHGPVFPEKLHRTGHHGNLRDLHSARMTPG